MELGNPTNTIVHDLLIGGITYLGHQDDFPMVSALVYMVTYEIKPIVNHNYLVVIIHQATILCKLSTLKRYWAYVEINTRFWPISETLMWLHILYGLRHYWWILVVIGILNIGTIISHGIDTLCPLGWS